MTSVYVIQATSGRHKIGISSNAARRLRKLQSGSEQRLALIMEKPVAEARAVEKMAHWLLKGSHIHGEWFAVTEVEARAAIEEAASRVEAGEFAPRSVGGPGRPAHGNKPTTLRFFLHTLKRIDALLGENRRAQFIREAVERELARLESEKG